MPDLPLDKWVKPEVLAQPAYRVRTVAHQIKLNQNESPWDWPDQLRQQVLDKIAQTDWNRYPELIPQRVQAKLAGYLGVAADQIVVGKGSNEILQALTTITLRAGDGFCILRPTFAVYKLLGEQRRAALVESRLLGDFQVDRDDFLAGSKAARLTILCNPNSPTGVVVEPDFIRAVARGANGLVAVDEAYVDFSGVTALPLLEECPNLIITRTFSKAFALAGFRLGYAVMHLDLAREVQKGLLPFNVDAPAALAAETLLDHTDVVADYSRRIVKERDRLSTDLNRLAGVRAWPSSSNFFLLETPLGAQGTFGKLAAAGLLVRDVSGYDGCGQLVRVTVGTPEENRALFKAVEALL